MIFVSGLFIKIIYFRLKVFPIVKVFFSEVDIILSPFDTSEAFASQFFPR